MSAQPYNSNWQPENSVDFFQPATAECSLMPGEIVSQAKIDEVVNGLKQASDSKEYTESLAYLNKCSMDARDRINDQLIKTWATGKKELTEAQALEWMQSSNMDQRIEACEYFREHPLQPKK
jgi:hypothetical protein